MSVRIAAGSGAGVRRSPTGFVVRVDVEPADAVAAARALDRARARLLGLDVPDPDLGLDPRLDANAVAYASAVIPDPRGAWFHVDGGHLPSRALVAVLDWTVEEVRDEGIEDAVVGVPTGASALDPLWRRDPGPALTRAWQSESLFRPGPPPAAWADLARGWLTGDAVLLRAGLHLLVPGADVPVEPDAVPRVLGLDGPARVQIRQVVSGGPESGFRFAQHVDAGECRLLTLGATGAAGEPLDALVAELTASAERSAAASTYSFLEVGWPDPLRDRPPLGDHPGRLNSVRLLDEVVFDAFPFQVLGPGHLRHLPDPPGDLQPLPGGRVSWRLGELAEWVDPERADALRASGRARLAALLPTEQQFLDRSSRRLQQQFDDRDGTAPS